MSIWGFLDPLRASLQDTIARLNQKLPLIEATAGAPGPPGTPGGIPLDAPVLTFDDPGGMGLTDFRQLLPGTNVTFDDSVGSERTINATGGSLAGLIDPTDYGYTVGRTDAVAPAVNNWAALSAATYDCYCAEIDGTATGGSTTSITDNSGPDFTDTYSTRLLDDLIDVGDGPEPAFEIVFITGDNKGRFTRITNVVSSSQLTLDPALPNAVAAGDEYRVLKHRVTQQRRWDKVLRLPPGRARIEEEWDAICSVASAVVDGSGMGVSYLEVRCLSSVSATTFNSATATTLTKTGAGWTVNQFKGKWVWTWAGTGTTAAAVLNHAKILSNTADTVTVDAWAGGTPAFATETFAIGHRSGMFLNGFTHCTFSNFTLEASLGDPFLFGIYGAWMRPNYAPDYMDRAAFSTSQNRFYNVQVYGTYAKQNIRYGNYSYAVNNQVDNGVFIGCHAAGAWVPGTSTDQRYSESVVAVGDGTGGNAVINLFVGCTFFYGQYGLMVNFGDAACVGGCFQSNGDTSRTGVGGMALGDVYVQGVSNYVALHFNRSELSSRFLSLGPVSIHQQLEIVQCSFHINGASIFAADGRVVDGPTYAGAIALRGFWVYGEDPNGYGSPRKATVRAPSASLTIDNVAIIGSDLEDGVLTERVAFFNGPYTKTDVNNLPVKIWYRGHRTLTASNTYNHGIDHDVFLSGASAAVDYTLPPATGSGRQMALKCVNATNTVRIVPTGAELIDGSNTPITLALNASRVLTDRATGNWAIM